ncbi:Transposase [compost metagenome]
MSTSTLGGHVNTIPTPAADQRRRRRKHSDEFKADAVAAATQTGMSMAAVALSRGINANLLRRWVHEAEGRATPAAPIIPARPHANTPPATGTFVPIQLPVPAQVVQDIRVEVRRGATTISVNWPTQAASECAQWIRELLR